jgi:hypothetical protein
MTSDQSEMIREAESRFNVTREGLEGRILVNTGLEVVLGIVLTGGLGSVASADAANALRTTAQLANGARTMGALARVAQGAQLFRAAYPIVAGVITTAGVGGGMALAGHGVRRFAGAETRLARGFDVAANFVPIGAGSRVARTGIQGGTRPASQLRQLAVHGLPAGVQAAGAGYLTPRVAQALGLEQSEAAQAAIGVVLTALGTGVVAGGQRLGTAAMQRHQARHDPEHAIVDVVLSTRERAQGFDARAARRDLTPMVADFLRATEGRMPTAREVQALRWRIYERIGIDPTNPQHNVDARFVNAALEGVRLDRAAQVSIREAGIPETGPITEARATRALELTAQRLFEARGGEVGGASRSRAYSDAVIGLAVRTGDRAQSAAGPLVDRVRAVETAALYAVEARPGEPPAIRTPEQQARVERVLGEEIGSLRRSLESGEGPASFDRLRTRLEREGGMAREHADAMINTIRNDVVDRANTALLARETETRGAELLPADLARVSRETAERGGMPRPDVESYAHDISKSPGVRDALRRRLFGWSRMSIEARQADYIRRNPEAQPLAALTGPQFRAAFGEGPYTSGLAGLAVFPGFTQFAQTYPAQARRSYQHMYNFNVQSYLRGQVPPDFHQAAAHFDAIMSERIITPTGAGDRPVPYRVVDVDTTQTYGQPALRLSPTLEHDFNGAFMQSAPRPNRFTNNTTPVHTDIPKDWMTFNPNQLIIGPNGQRATNADMGRIAVFSAHGTAFGFYGLSTPQAARAMAAEIAAHQARHPGRQQIEFVMIDSCSQCSPRMFIGETNAAVFQREINRALAAAGHPPVRILAAEHPGSLYGSHYSAALRGRSGQPTDFVEPHLQNGRFAPEHARYALYFGAAIAVKAGVFYGFSEWTRRRNQPPAPTPGTDRIEQSLSDMRGRSAL